MNNNMGMGQIEYVWLPPPLALDLSNDEVHLWRACLDTSEGLCEHLEKYLSPDEAERAGRFRFEKVAQRFVLARGLLRAILGCYLEVDPRSLQFTTSSGGKPSLSTKRYGQSLCFNLSHSHNLVVYAVAQNRLVGIDVELIGERGNAEELAKRFFSPAEYNLICSLSPTEKSKVFIELWTIKEAYLKATGDGLQGLEKVEIVIARDGSPQLFSRLGNPGQVIRGWSVYPFTPAPEYLGCIVVEGDAIESSRFKSFDPANIVQRQLSR